MSIAESMMKVSSDKQTLSLYIDDTLFKTYLISTAKNGLGEEENSEKTPRGWHEIAEKIGAEQAVNTVFVSRVPTGEIYTPTLRANFPDRDWILTRILRLKGLEEGRNRGPGIDSYDRYIYIHGTPDETHLGKIGSKGCIRMANTDIIELFDKVSIGSKIIIE